MTIDGEQDQQAEQPGLSDMEEDLEALLKENETLQAENEALKGEMAQNAVSFALEEETIDLTAEEEAVRLQVQVEALRREQEALQSVLRLGEELQGLERTNITLREATRQLAEENAKLLASAPPAVSSQAPVFTERSEVQLDVLDTRVQSLVASLADGDEDVLSHCVAKRREEIVAAMLKSGLLDAFGAGSPWDPPSPAAAKGLGLRSRAAHEANSPTAAAAGTPALIEASKSLPLLPVALGPGDELAEAIKKGDSRALSYQNSSQRKELIASMLKTGLFCAPPGAILAAEAEDRTAQPSR